MMGEWWAGEHVSLATGFLPELLLYAKANRVGASRRSIAGLAISSQALVSVQKCYGCRACCESFVRQRLPNTGEEQVFSIVKNLQVTVISKAFYKYSSVSGRHLFPPNTTQCVATGLLRSGSGLLRKLIFCTYIHLVKAKHICSPWDSDGNSLVAWVYPCTLISLLCLFSE